MAKKYKDNELAKTEYEKQVSTITIKRSSDGTTYSDNDSTYWFQYNFEEALTEDGIYRPSITPSVFELKDPSRDIYGKLV